jgi:hypothetical protein
MHKIRHLLWLGWKAMSVASTASWVLGGGALSSLVAAWVWFEHQPSSIIATVFIVVLAATFVCTLAYLGSRQTKMQQKKQTEPPPQEIAPHQLPKAAPERAPLLDIVEMARKAGWDTDAFQSNDASELTARLNQAAADGTIKFWGRKYEYDLGETAVTNFPLIEIPAEHFTEFSFQPLNLFKDGQRNFYIFTGKLGRQPRELRGQIYQDIHACRAQLAEWMSRNSPNGESKQ